VAKPYSASASSSTADFTKAQLEQLAQTALDSALPCATRVTALQGLEQQAVRGYVRGLGVAADAFRL